MSFAPRTPLVRITPDDIYPGFSEMKDGPNRGGYSDEEYSAEYDKWNEGRVYKLWHKYVPPLYVNAYEMPQKAVDWVMEIVDGERQPSNLIYTGQVGVGKSYSAAATACLLVTKWSAPRYCPKSIHFTLTSNLLSTLKNWGLTDGERDDALNEACTSKVLVLDDLGRYKTTDHDAENLGRILDARLGAMLPTVFTTNVNPGEDVKDKLVNQFGDYLASRILGGATIAGIAGTDRRFETR